MWGARDGPFDDSMPILVGSPRRRRRRRPSNANPLGKVSIAGRSSINYIVYITIVEGENSGTFVHRIEVLSDDSTQASTN